MIKLKKIIMWLMISIAVQTGILFYLSNFYLTDDYEVTFTQESIGSSINNIVDIKLPQDAEKVKLSPLGKYVSYALKNKLHVIRLDDGTDNTINLDNEIGDYFFRWHDYEDKLIIAERKTIQNEDGIKIYNYNPKDNIKQEALDYNNKSKTYKFSTKDVEIADIQLNTLNTILYVKALNKNGTSYINRLDISDGMHKIPLSNSNFGEFFVLKQKDELVFEDLSKEKIYITNKSRTEEIKITAHNELRLLKVDKEDTIYIGELENNMIKAIYYSDKDYKEWRSISLEKPTVLENIYLYNYENIYSIDKTENTVTNINSKDHIKFEGKFLGMNHKGILYLNEENSIVTKLINTKVTK